MEYIIFKNLPYTSNNFSLSDVYNKCNKITTEPSIRFYLQRLRDKNLLIFHGKGIYSYTDTGIIKHIFIRQFEPDIDIWSMD